MKNVSKKLLIIERGDGVTEGCRLSWLTNSALVYEPKCGGEGGGVPANDYTAVHKMHMELK